MKVNFDSSFSVKRYLSLNTGDVRKDILACGLRGLQKGRGQKKDKEEAELEVFLLLLFVT